MFPPTQPRLAFGPLALLLVLVACVRAPEPVQAPYNRTWPEWNLVLARHVREGGVDYAGLAAQRADLDAAMTAFAAVRPETFRTWAEADRLAYLINLHNAAAIRRVVNAWPVDSMESTRLFGSALNERDIAALGRAWSLRDLQTTILGEEFLEARAVFLLNWGELACAPLPPVAITGLNLSDLLDRQSRRVLSDPRYLNYDQRDRVINVTPLLRRHREQFERDFTTERVFLGQYLPEAEARVFKARPPRIRYLDWEHGLNGASR